VGEGEEGEREEPPRRSARAGAGEERAPALPVPVGAGEAAAPGRAVPGGPARGAAGWVSGDSR